MKKFHFIMTGLMLLFAAQANAQIGSISDLFGNYKFTADIFTSTEVAGNLCDFFKIDNEHIALFFADVIFLFASSNEYAKSTSYMDK